MKIEVKNMDFFYGSKKILTDINLEIEKPGLICIVGPNGVGKSTLVKCILGLHKPSAGTILVDGVDISLIPPKELSKIMGFVPVQTNEVFSMSVVDTIMMGRYPHQKMGVASDLDWKIVNRAMNMMQVKHLATQNFNELSAGQHQKVAITKGLAQTPRVLILDEPTSNLDAKHQLQVMETLRDIAHEVGMIIIMVSHDLNLSSKFADEVIMMSVPGVIHKVGLPEEVLTADNISTIYGVECEVIIHKGRPHVILERALEEN
ncbi:MAG: ABC transporter ATP-binding protein [archaeon]|nr:ABC transporter ATP-binding protein [archaeon]